MSGFDSKKFFAAANTLQLQEAVQRPEAKELVFNCSLELTKDYHTLVGFLRNLLKDGIESALAIAMRSFHVQQATIGFTSSAISSPVIFEFNPTTMAVCDAVEASLEKILLAIEKSGYPLYKALFQCDSCMNLAVKK